MAKSSKKKRKLAEAAKKLSPDTSFTIAFPVPTSSPPKRKFASVYKRDLGITGIKEAVTGPASFSKNTFKIKKTGAEKVRRKERELRFAKKETSRNSKASKVDDAFKGQNNTVAADAVFSALSSPRYPSEPSKSKEKKRKKPDGTTSRLVGTCRDLEKPYLRLTDFPKAEDVRPEPVLRRALKHIKNRYISEDDFGYANEQLKSVRQDVTVQGVRDDFVLDLYETHARILLEHGDLNEFNQCQTMILTLTTGNRGEDSSLDTIRVKLGGEINGGEKLLKQCEESADEFAGYRILYCLVMKSGSDLKQTLSECRTRLQGGYHPQSMSTTKHALMVVRAVLQNDYRAFFRLYSSAPHMSAYLMDFLVQRVRQSAYDCIIASYRPTVSVEFVREALTLSTLDEARQYLKKRGAAFLKEKGETRFWIDCKSCKPTT